MSRSPVEWPQCRHQALSYLHREPSELCWKIFKKSAQDIVLHVALVSSSWVVTVRLYSVRKVKGTIKVDLPTFPVTTPTLSIMKISRPIIHYHLHISVDLHLFDKLYWLVYFMAASFHDTSLVFSVSILAQTCWFFYICYDLLGFRCYQWILFRLLFCFAGWFFSACCMSSVRRIGSVLELTFVNPLTPRETECFLSLSSQVRLVY